MHAQWVHETKGYRQGFWLPSTRGSPWELRATSWHKHSPSRGFPGGSLVKNLPASAGDTGWISDLGGPHIPRSSWAHAAQVFSLWSIAQKPQLLSPPLQLLKPMHSRIRALQREATTVRSLSTATKNSPHSPQLEKSPSSNKEPAQL